MANRTSFITLDTRQYSTPESEVTNARGRQLRAEDLSAYGRSGYELLSTIVVPQHDGITIVDTLARTD